MAQCIHCFGELPNHRDDCPVGQAKGGMEEMIYAMIKSLGPFLESTRQPKPVGREAIALSVLEVLLNNSNPVKVLNDVDTYKGNFVFIALQVAKEFENQLNNSYNE